MSVQRNLKALGTFGYMAHGPKASRVYSALHPAHAGARAAQPGALSRAVGLRRALAPPSRGAASRLTHADRAHREFTNHVGQEVASRAGSTTSARSGKLQFLIVRDGSGFAQAVMAKAAVPGGAWAGGGAMRARSRRSELTGRVKEDKRAPGGLRGGRHAASPSLQVAHDYPITPKDHGTAFLMENRHLWLRSQRQHAIIRVRHAVVKAVRDYLDDQGFTLVDTPIFTPAACEGTTTLFGVPYFDEGTAYLTQSGQLYNEANAAAHGKVYCFGPTLPRREVEDAAPPHRVLDGRAGDARFAHLDDAVEAGRGPRLSP